jgi:hypothetical protein
MDPVRAASERLDLLRSADACTPAAPRQQESLARAAPGPGLELEDLN